MKKENVSAFELGGENPVAQYFIGHSYYAQLSSPESQINLANVTFEPGCRNNWHIHHGAQQVLACVGGEGWYQEWGKDPIRMKPGDVVEIPLDVKHWHGATKDSYFAHLSIMTNLVEGDHEWLEAVEDDYYLDLHK